MSLSERIRSGCEAAPWVSDEVQNLEAKHEELLEAATNVVEWWDSDSGVSPSAYGLIDQLRAAIAKAKGEEP